METKEPTQKEEVMKTEDIRLEYLDEVEKATNEGRGMRFNSGKRKWSLVDFRALEPMVQVLEFGAKKYVAHQWKKGLNKEEMLESLMRHLVALMEGETHDPESGEHHIGHLMCNAMFYSHFHKDEVSNI